ncbi:T-complex protein 11-domain-containing protein [Halteromyces radiatus]|uniref:T-complex protein 11-domain-containing protein n=1 Tax=Halteromyces radiatus TaxID=101107 RepID=UPI002220E5C6|nr:T-complex protein 11-domain-containing protein [Halteromyces radiatus]KAI8086399.1 T-complex protein 11-domain-containing protein [Halteromyces radiatus]
MTTNSIPLSDIQKALCAIDDWFDEHRSDISPLERLALEEVWNAYYAVTEASQLATDQLLNNLSTLYLESIRLQQFLFDLERRYSQNSTMISSISLMLTQLENNIRQLAPSDQLDLLLEAAERIVVSHITTRQATSHSIPSSPTPRPEKLEPTLTIGAEQLNRLLSGYASSVGGLSNEQLAHELIMNPDFQVQKATPTSDLEQRIDSMARKAFFDQINDDIQHAHLEQSLLPLLRDIKTRLLSFVSATSTFYRTIDDTLDLTLFEQQMKHPGVFDLKKVIDFVLDMMSHMAAPIRDEAIHNVKTMTVDETHHQGHQLRLIMEILDLMSLDLMNFRLKSLRPHLIQVAVEYEHNAFAQAMAHGSVGIAKTRQWLQQALQRLINKKQERQQTSSSSSSSTSKDDWITVVNEGYIELLTATTAWTPLTCPETILLDVGRIVEYQNELQQVTIVAALAMLARNTGVKDIKAFTKRVFLLLKDQHHDGGDRITLNHLALEMEQAISLTDVVLDDQRKQWIRSMVGKTLAHSDPVYGLLTQRVASVIRHFLTFGKHMDDSALMQSGLDPIRPQLQTLCTRIRIFAEHNRRVYASWYQQLMDSLQQQQQRV